MSPTPAASNVSIGGASGQMVMSGQIVPGPGGGFITGTLGQGTTLADDIANQYTESVDQVLKANVRIQSWFDQAVQNYNNQMATGETSAASLVVPPAPKSYELTPPDQMGFVYWAQTGPPLVPTPPLTVATFNAYDAAQSNLHTPPKRFIHVGKRDYGNWFSAGDGNVVLDNSHTYIATSDDGVKGIFSWVPEFGNTGWWLLQQQL